MENSPVAAVAVPILDSAVMVLDAMVDAIMPEAMVDPMVPDAMVDSVVPMVPAVAAALIVDAPLAVEQTGFAGRSMLTLGGFPR